MPTHPRTPLDELERLLGLCEVQAIRSGVPLPLGASARRNGVNFAIFSRHATGVRLDFFDQVGDSAPARSVLLDALRNKTGDIWHVWLEGIRPGQLYGFRFARAVRSTRRSPLQSGQAGRRSVCHRDSADSRT